MAVFRKVRPTHPQSIRGEHGNLESSIAGVLTETVKKIFALQKKGVRSNSLNTPSYAYDNFVYEMKGANGAHLKNMKRNKIKVHLVIGLDIPLHIDILCTLDHSTDSVNLVIDH